MVKEISYTDEFKRAVKKIRDSAIKERVKKQIDEIRGRPDIGKPLRFERKGERTVWVPPFRIIYSWELETEKLCFIDFEKRNKVYR